MARFTSLILQAEHLNLRSRMKRYFLIIIIFFSSFAAIGQGPQQGSFYRHYSGLLDTNMRLTMDLFSVNGKITGYYFYSFQIAGGSGEYHFGKTIPLTGTLDATRLVLHEYSNTESKFTANVKKDNSIKGSWQRRTYEDPIPFSLEEDYKIGSIPLDCIPKTATHVLDLQDVAKNERPRAKIDLMLLYPPKSVNKQLTAAIDQAMAAFILNDSSSIGDPELLVENITFDFFQSYREATDGIPNIEKTASFNWQKKLSMEVLYNENSLLSLRIDKYGYTGGAHGVSISRFRVFNLLHNKPVEFSDIFIDDFEGPLNELLEKKLRKINGIKPDEQLSSSGFLVDTLVFNDNFYVNNDGIGFFFNVYEIASYATGTTDLFCSFYELRAILRPDHPFFWIAD